MNDTVIALACEGLNKALNHALEHDPQTPQKLSELAGKSLSVEATAPYFRVCILFTETQLTIMPGDDGSSTSQISGTAPALIRFVLTGDIEAACKCQVEITGEEILVSTLLALSRQIDIDWEALFAEHTSDVPAHLLGEFLRKAQQFQLDLVTRSKNGWETYNADTKDNSEKQLSPLEFISAQLKALMR